MRGTIRIIVELQGVPSSESTCLLNHQEVAAILADNTTDVKLSAKVHSFVHGCIDIALETLPSAEVAGPPTTTEYKMPELNRLTHQEEDVFMDWTNNAEGELRALVKAAQAREGSGFERLQQLLEHTNEDLDRSLTAWLQANIWRWYKDYLTCGYCGDYHLEANCPNVKK